ncbi:hypothetical protein Tco_0318059 [Tanacetum coccineum]
MIQHEFITLTLAQFGQILIISYNGQVVFTNKWDLASLAYSQETEGPYHTDLPTPNDIRQFLQLDRVELNRTIKSQNVTLNPNQILTKELRQDMKHWEELIRENTFRLRGHQDHLQASLAHMLYLILEYLVNISKRRAFWSLNEDILMINDSEDQYVVSIMEDTVMDDPNMTMEKNIKLEEEKARRRGQVFNWQTATYGKIRFDDDLHDLRSVEAEFPAIVINDAFAPQDTLLCKSQVSTPVNDEIYFRISFDESDDEDYTIICDKNSFSYKMISVNNLKTNSENDNEKAGIPSFPPTKPTISYVDDLDFFKDFENEFPAIVFNDAQTSKSKYLTEATLYPHHIDEFDLNDETSLSECDEVEQNILYFNDLFPFNVIHAGDLKSDKDNDNNKIDIIQSSGGNFNTHRSNMLMETSRDKIDKFFDEESFVLELNVNIVTWIYLFNEMLLCFIMNLNIPFSIPFDPKRYYKDGDCTLMLRRPRTPLPPSNRMNLLFIRIAKWVKMGRYEKPLFIFKLQNDTAYPLTWIRHMAPLPPREQRHPFLRYQGLEYTDADVANFEERLEMIYSREIHSVQVVDFQGMPELMRDGLFARMVMEHRDDAVLVRWSRETIELEAVYFGLGITYRGVDGVPWGISTDGDFLGPPPSYTLISDPVLRLCHRMMAHNIARRSQAPKKFVARLAEQFGLLTAEILGGLTVVEN